MSAESGVAVSRKIAKKKRLHRCWGRSKRPMMRIFLLKKPKVSALAVSRESDFRDGVPVGETASDR